MAYKPSLSDIDNSLNKNGSYQPSISDIDEVNNDSSNLSSSPNFKNNTSDFLNNLTSQLGKSGGSAIGYLAESLSDPSNTASSYTKPFAEGTMHGLGEFGRGIEQNLYAKPLDYLLGGNRNQSIIDAQNASDQKFKSISDQAPILANLGNITGNVAPFLGGGELAELGKAPSWISDIVGGAQHGLGGQLARGGSIAAKNAGFGAGANLLSYNPSQNTDYKQEATSGAVGGLLGAGAGKLIESLMPSNLLRGKLSPTDLQNNLNITKDTNTGLGDVIGSPMLKRQLENVFTRMPLSKANEALQNIGNQTVSNGENALKSILGIHQPSDVTDQIHDTLLDQYDIHQNQKNNLYNETNKIADNDPNFKMQATNFANTAKKYSDAIDSTNILKNEPDVKSLFNKLQNYINPTKETKNIGSIVDTSGNPLINETNVSYPTLQEANLLKGKLNQYANNFGQSSDASQRSLSSVFGNLAKSLKSDINTSIKNSGNKELADSYSNAEENYGKNFSPFLDKQIYKYISGKADPDTLIGNFIKTGPVSNGRSNLIQSIQQRLPQESQGLFAYGYFSRALDNEGNLNPGKLSTLIGKLGNKQLETLVPDPGLREKLLNFKKLYQMNTKPVNMMFNNDTGQKVLDIAPWLIHGAGALTGERQGEQSGGPLGSVIGAIAGGFAPGLALRPLVSALTSPSIRENLVKKMIAGGTKLPASIYGINDTTLAKALKQQQVVAGQ